MVIVMTLARLYILYWLRLKLCFSIKMSILSYFFKICVHSCSYYVSTSFASVITSPFHYNTVYWFQFFTSLVKEKAIRDFQRTIFSLLILFIVIIRFSHEFLFLYLLFPNTHFPCIHSVDIFLFRKSNVYLINFQPLGYFLSDINP